MEFCRLLEEKQAGVGVDHVLMITMMRILRMKAVMLMMHILEMTMMVLMTKIRVISNISMTIIMIMMPTMISIIITMVVTITIIITIKIKIITCINGTMSSGTRWVLAPLVQDDFRKSL